MSREEHDATIRQTAAPIVRGELHDDPADDDVEFVTAMNRSALKASVIVVLAFAMVFAVCWMAGVWKH